MRPILIASALTLAALPTTAVAQSMNAEAFHKRALALQKKGPMALFSRGEIKALMTEGKAASERSRAQRLAAIKSGATPRYCPPEGSKFFLDSNEFMKKLGAIPAEERRRIDMTEVMTRIFAAKHPCKA